MQNAISSSCEQELTLNAKQYEQLNDQPVCRKITSMAASYFETIAIA